MGGPPEDRETVRPVLDFLDRAESIERYLHRDVRTRNEFEAYLEYWQEHRHRWPLVYLAFHGYPGRLTAGDEPYSLEPLADLVQPAGGGVFYLGACETLSGADGKGAAQRSLKQTGATAILGFEASVARIEAAALT